MVKGFASHRKFDWSWVPDEIIFGPRRGGEINAGDGDELILARRGDDIIYAGGGNDRVLAGAGNDEIHDGAGSDIVKAGRGDDVIVFDATQRNAEDRDLFMGGAGYDTLKVTVTADLMAQFQEELAAYSAQLESNNSKGWFTFESLSLTVHSIEEVEVEATGNPDLQITGSNQTIENGVLNFGILGIGLTSAVELTIENMGDATAVIFGETGMDAPFDFFGGTYPGNGGTAGLSIDPGEEELITIEFNPLAGGTFEDTMILEYEGPAGDQFQLTLDLIGEGI